MQAVPRRRLAHLQRLAQHPAERRKAGQFLIEGAVLLNDALDAGLHVNEVLLERERAGDAEKAAAERARGRGAICSEVADGVLSRIGASVTPPPILAVAEIPGGVMHGGQHLGEARDGHAGGAIVLAGGEGATSEKGLTGEGEPAGGGAADGTGATSGKEASPEGFSLAAVEIADPSNAGALLRCAEGAGASEVFFAGNCVDPWGPKVVRASAGSVFRMPPRRETDVEVFLQSLSQAGRKVVATASDRGLPYHEHSFEPGTVILAGNETHGLPEIIEDFATDWIHIPLAGATESLNVAMAASVICFEASRQLGTMVASSENATPGLVAGMPQSSSSGSLSQKNSRASEGNQQRGSAADSAESEAQLPVGAAR